MRSIMIIFMANILIAGCTPQISNKITPDLLNPTVIPVIPTTAGQIFQPLPGDSQLQEGNIYIESSELLIMESFPLQINLVITGNLPDPCHHLRVKVNPPDQSNFIKVEAYSVADTNTACIQVLEPFNATVPLGSYPSGHYTVYLNSVIIGEFDS